MFPWFPKGADVCPLGFSISGRTDAKLAEFRESWEIKNEDDLAAALMCAHAQIPKTLVGTAIDSAPKRIDMLIKAGGGLLGREK